MEKIEKKFKICPGKSAAQQTKTWGKFFFQLQILIEMWLLNDLSFFFSHSLVCGKHKQKQKGKKTVRLLQILPETKKIRELLKLMILQLMTARLVQAQVS